MSIVCAIERLAAAEGPRRPAPDGTGLQLAASARPRNLASRLNELMPAKLRFRSHAEVARFFEGLDLVEPGLVRVPEWRPDSDADRANPAAVWGGVARKN